MYKRRAQSRLTLKQRANTFVQQRDDTVAHDDGDAIVVYMCIILDHFTWTEDRPVYIEGTLTKVY